MFQGLSIKSKKTFKDTQSKKANKGTTASLESTRNTSLSESFSERFSNLRVNDNSGSNSYSNAKTSKSYEKTLARIIENQGEILSKLKVIKDKDTIKGAAKALIKKAIYPENSQIKSEPEKYVRENYTEYFEKFTLKNWNIYYVNNIHGPKLFEELEEDSDEIYMTRILNKIWPDGKALPKKIAYAIAVCQTMLNPKNKIITMSDHIIKKLIAINLNKLKYGEHFSISSSEDDTNKEDRDKFDDNDSENDNTV
ncbi:hypothetical protein C2G38_2159067 [Gigaspora rosea]|uniref:Uncharacterized protein n=1 Tax=Gigaspora rosea TaxID=44941 RepID=A0A397W1C3_9GLOM|nr:hypothetical protein C2G38_2159067 [Gigaspora rosea]